MATKLEKAQVDYERLLRDLGSRAEMVGVLDKAEPAILKNYRKAQESLEDRKVELGFIQAEMERVQSTEKSSLEKLQQDVTASQEELKRLEKAIEVKKDKAKPVSTKLAGAEYDLKFVERALAEEVAKAKKAREVEDAKRAKDHDENIKRLKIEALKRRKTLQDLKNEVRDLESPAKGLEKQKEELVARLAEQEEQLELAQEAAGGDSLGELERQLEEKQRDVRMAEQHMLDVLADVGEDLYEKRVDHPVLEKYYEDLDVVAQAIDKLQEG
jgi:chromosome segregation ATPase